MKSHIELILFILIIVAITGFGLWRAISLSIPRPHFANFIAVPNSPNSRENNFSNNLSKTEAILLAQNSFLELKNYPSNNLPPSSIESEMAPNGWNLSFQIHGSGVSNLLSAKCYLVTSDKEVTFTGEYNPSVDQPYKADAVRLSDCQPVNKDVADYIVSHLSDLSGVKEILGGRYYVTRIEIHNGNGSVSYEDGHQSHDVSFSWVKSTDGQVEINSFTVIR